jgi:MATE family multidrug resistance protein
MFTLRSTRHDREILRIAVPALGALAADPLVSLVDTAFVGRLGAGPLGSLGVAVALFGIAFAVFNFLAYGTTPLIAGAMAAGDRSRAIRMGSVALAVGAGLGVAMAVVVEVAAVPLVRFMGAAPDALTGAVTYLQIRAAALPAAMIVMVGHGVFRGHHDTRTPLAITVGLNVVNLVLDPIFIFTLDGGLAGAAWATMAAQWVGAIWFVAAMLRRGHLGALGSRTDIVRELRMFLAAGRALVLRTSALLGTLTLATAVAARVGTGAVAAHQVASQVWLFLALVVDALAIAGQALVAGRMARSRREAGDIARRLLGLGLVVGVLLGSLLAAGATVVPSLFTDDPVVIDGVERVYWFVVAMQPLNALVFVWDGIAMGAGAFGYLAASMVGAAVIAATVLAMVIPFGWGLSGVWWAMVALMLARGATLAHWHRSGPLAA